ncbi:hypothetical protein KO02_12520 [Sphingobacterium sp. ML3W]|uniref:hypothetical protein n=1 Tax=Sphingobacterium sp. ML3W TaxID=1538644 RepID=UPI0004F818BE|nr:hypothetical protein [Sphingobacterium sp. ML3W]AIM37419.1 hypothetical protein KO02_12520 [Sphingobacterium sp. ML3W]
MQKLTLNWLQFANFMGFENRKIEFGPKITNVYGANGTGKTTLIHGYKFMLEDKNAENNSDFTKKHLNKDGVSIKNASASVEGEFDNNGKQLKTFHSQVENWKTEDGVDRLVGHTNIYRINDLVRKAGEYKSEIGSIISEETFKMITDPFHFNSLDQEIRRKYIEAICGTKSDEDIAKSKSKYNELIDEINLITLNGLKSKLKNRKAEVQKDINRISVRIEEALHNIPEEFDTEALSVEIKFNETKYKELEDKILDSNTVDNAKNDAKKNLINQIHEKELENLTILNTHKLAYEKALMGARSEWDNLNKELSEINLKLTKLDAEIVSAESTPGKVNLLNREVEKISADLLLLVEQFDDKNSQKFDVNDNSFICKYCGELPSDPNKVKEKREEMRVSFYKVMNTDLDAIEQKGKTLKELKEKSESEIKELTDLHDIYKKQLSDRRDEIVVEKNEIESRLLDMPDPDLESVKITTTEERVFVDKIYRANSDEISSLKLKQLEVITDESVNKVIQDLRVKKALINADLESLRRKSMSGEVRIKALARKEEINSEGILWGQEVAEIQRRLTLIGFFERDKAKIIEELVAKHFKLVRFKFFDINLGDGEVKPTCITMVDGVPFGDLNHAKKINAGIDIINTISSHYGVSAPIFIDNRESVTDLITTDAQVINLIVSPFSKLSVDNPEYSDEFLAEYGKYNIDNNLSLSLEEYIKIKLKG